MEQYAQKSEDFQPIMPLLKAIRKARLKIQIYGETTLVTDVSGKSIEAFDLVHSYSVGTLKLPALVSEVPKAIGQLMRTLDYTRRSRSRLPRRWRWWLINLGVIGRHFVGFNAPRMDLSKLWFQRTSWKLCR